MFRRPSWLLAALCLAVTSVASAQAQVTVTIVDTLGGAQSVITDPYCINNLGQVVGLSNTSTGSTHAFVWTAPDRDCRSGNVGWE